MTWRLCMVVTALVLTAPAAAEAVTVGAPLNVPPSTNSGCEALVFIGPGCGFASSDAERQ